MVVNMVESHMMVCYNLSLLSTHSIGELPYEGEDYGGDAYDPNPNQQYNNYNQEQDRYGGNNNYNNNQQYNNNYNQEQDRYGGNQGGEDYYQGNYFTTFYISFFLSVLIEVLLMIGDYSNYDYPEQAYNNDYSNNTDPSYDPNYV
jgi:hypothetical protein